ncbi:hypothetical protein XH98_12295 [Bradyrhizobium sp. CCBAU 51745]|nr:hypothetical protein [Bradyrhizobium sp. CCBAU 51745]
MSRTRCKVKRCGAEPGRETEVDALHSLHRHCEEPFATKQPRIFPRRDSGLLRYARNDGARVLHGAPITRILLADIAPRPASTMAHPTFVTIAIRPSDREEVTHEYAKVEFR